MIGGYGTLHCRRPRRGWVCPLLPNHAGPCPQSPRLWNLWGMFWGRTK